MILVDTDVLIEIFDKNSEKGSDALRQIEKTGEEILITSLNLHEILYGLGKYARIDKIEKILLLDVVEFKKEDAVLSAKIEHKLEKKGRMIGRLDSMVAAVAVNRKLTFFTFNKKDFEKIPELELF